jgi:hypothetical protein
MKTKILYIYMCVCVCVCVCVCACVRACVCVLLLLLLVHGDYSSIFNFQTKILAIYPGIFIFFAVFQKSYVFIPLFLLGTPNDVLWKVKVPRNPV